MSVMVSGGDVEVTVSWSRPLYPNGILTSYMVSVEDFGGDTVIGPMEVANDTLFTAINISSLGEWSMCSTMVCGVYHCGLWIFPLQSIYMCMPVCLLTQRMVCHTM